MWNNITVLRLQYYIVLVLYVAELQNGVWLYCYVSTSFVLLDVWLLLSLCVRSVKDAGPTPFWPPLDPQGLAEARQLVRGMDCSRQDEDGDTWVYWPGYMMYRYMMYRYMMYRYIDTCCIDTWCIDTCSDLGKLLKKEVICYFLIDCVETWTDIIALSSLSAYCIHVY